VECNFYTELVARLLSVIRLLAT